MSMEAGVLPMTVEEIADSVGGSLHDTDPDTALTGCAQYDLRLMESGGLFVAFQGQRVGGHDLASHAVGDAGRKHVGETASDVTVINDAYHSCPVSTSATLRTAVAPASGTNELVPDSLQQHIEPAANAGVHYMIGVGNADARRIVSSAVAREVEAEQMPDAPAALELVRRSRATGDVLLIKGSDALGLQSPAQRLLMDGATQDHANAKRMGK
jgi:UDP-N-acetylmuramyl pentapeptide synthase